MPYLLATNVLSELRKGAGCDSNVRQWAQATARDRHCISVLSLGEIRKGIEILRRKAPDQCPAFERWLAEIMENYRGEILLITPEIVDRWGRMQAAQSMPVTDSLIAATALEHGLAVATRNATDFERTGVALINPFQH